MVVEWWQRNMADVASFWLQTRAATSTILVDRRAFQACIPKAPNSNACAKIRSLPSLNFSFVLLLFIFTSIWIFFNFVVGIIYLLSKFYDALWRLHTHMTFFLNSFLFVFFTFQLNNSDIQNIRISRRWFLEIVASRCRQKFHFLNSLCPCVSVFVEPSPSPLLLLLSSHFYSLDSAFPAVPRFLSCSEVESSVSFHFC